jgi:Rod binding domain-containing protein
MDTAALLTLQNAQAASGTAAQQALAAQMKGGKSNARLGADFETMCLSNLLSPMFEGLSTDGPFGGGEGESAMRSFFIDAIAKQISQHGGLGISDMMQKQLLKLQGAQ